MQYFDKNGKEIRAGMKILMEDGSIEMVYDTEDQYGNPNLGINASNEEFLRFHPNWAREYYSLSMFKQSGIEVCPSEQEIRTELEELAPIIEGTELALDYGEKVSKEDYEKYEAAIARRTILTSMLGEDSPAPEMTMQPRKRKTLIGVRKSIGIETVAWLPMSSSNTTARISEQKSLTSYGSCRPTSMSKSMESNISSSMPLPRKTI